MDVAIGVVVGIAAGATLALIFGNRVVSAIRNLEKTIEAKAEAVIGALKAKA